MRRREKEEEEVEEEEKEKEDFVRGEARQSERVSSSTRRGKGQSR
jgi:hypothetical protein